MNAKEANKISIVTYLDQMGIRPSKVKAGYCFYYSPYREESTPSFKVSPSKNLWVDFGDGNAGGTLIDLVPFTYLWFVGVIPEKQNNGFGSEILKYLLDYSKTLNRPVYLETSTETNLPWYKKHGLDIYTVSERFGFPFYFLKTA